MNNEGVGDGDSAGRGEMSERRHSTLKSGERMLNVIKILTGASSASMGLTEIAACLGDSKSVTHRSLATLVGEGFVQQTEDRKYALGPAVLGAAHAFLRNTSISAALQEKARTLSVRFGETVSIVMRSGRYRSLVEQYVPSRQGLVLAGTVGDAVPLHVGAGRALLSFSDESIVDDYFAALGDTQEIQRARLNYCVKRDLDQARGYSYSIGERTDGVAAIGVPIFQTNSIAPDFAVLLGGPTDRVAANAGVFAEALLDLSVLFDNRCVLSTLSRPFQR